MASPEDEEREIPIRCPGCGARFRVGDELMGRMVECGSCDHRFRVAEEVVTRKRKFYPGEARDPRLDRFGRIPSRAALQPNFETVHYDEGVSPRALEPTSPIRILAALLGAGLAVLVALILVFGGSPGGVLDGAPTGRRLILAVFVALISGALVVWGNPKVRAKALFLSVLMAAALISLPFFFKAGTEEIVLPGLADDGDLVDLVEGLKSEEDGSDGGGDRFAELKEDVGYRPLADALGRYGEGGESQGETAVGLWLRGMLERHKMQVRDYVIRAAGASNESWMYLRDSDEFLMVVIDVPKDFQAIESICSRFGEVVRTVEELNLVEVKVDNDSFVQGPLEKLIDPSNPAFYELNRRELESIDFRRARDAARRLAGVEPKLYRPDIVSRLQELMRIGDTPMFESAASALQVWAEDGDGSVAVAREVAAQLHRETSKVPRSVVEFLAQARDLESVEFVHQLWLANPAEWEALYGDFGGGIEPALLEGYADYSLSEKRSATRLLGRVGTEASLETLEAAREGAGGELAVLIDKAIQSIGER